MIIRSPHVAPGKFAIGDAKRLLQQYRHETDITDRANDVGSSEKSGYADNICIAKIGS